MSRYVFGAPAGRSCGSPTEKEAPGGIVAIGSPFFLFFTLDVLFKQGSHELALEVIRKSWATMPSISPTCLLSFDDLNRILDAITRAGGIKSQGYETWVMLERDKKRATVPFENLVMNAANNIYVQPGDRINLEVDLLARYVARLNETE